MTHEAVHADSEQVGEAAQLRAGGLGWTITGQSDGGQDDHHRECQPSEQKMSSVVKSKAT